MTKIQRNLDKNFSSDMILSYLTAQEKYQLVGSFVIENFWDNFIKINIESITKFRDIAKKSITNFIEVYQDVWNYVVEINQLDDIFLRKIVEIRKYLDGLSITELKLANKLLSLSLYSELEKDCLMALNKTILTELANDLKKKYQFNDDDFQLLMTPSFETFFTKYHFDHFEYSLTDDPVSKEKIAVNLINEYHAKDPELFKIRFSNMHFPDGFRAKEMLEFQKNTLKDKSKKKLAFIDGKDDLIAFEKLLEYDNFLDFKYRYNLEACPEYYVRQLLFRECKSKGLFHNVNSPMDLKDGEFIEKIDDLINLVEKNYIIKVEGKYLKMNELNSNIFSKISIDGKISAIKYHLKQGSPCLIKGDTKKYSTQLAIVGYDEDILLAQRSDNLIIKINEVDLKNFNSFIVLQKFDPTIIAGLEKSIRKYIERKPYLNRHEYESAFI